MGRDAWGADWGRYFRNKSNRKQKRQPIPCVYLLSRPVRQREQYGNQGDIVVKVGQTKRHPVERCRNDTGIGFTVLCYWPIEMENLRQVEARILNSFRHHFGEPVQGREYFVAGSQLRAIQVARQTLGGDEPLGI